MASGYKMMDTLKFLWKLPTQLWLVFACEYADSISTFALDYVLVLYLSAGFGMSDVTASFVYALYGGMVLFFGVLFGPLIDNLGVKWSLLTGSVASSFARLAIVFETDPLALMAALLILLPMGVSLTSNVLKLGVRRYTTAADRSSAFDIS